MTTPASGNRWEPVVGTTAEATEPAYVDHGPVGPTGRGPRRRLWLVGVAAAFLLVGGVGGVLVGHATAGHGGSTGGVAPASDRAPRTGFGSNQTHGLPPGSVHDPDSDDGIGRNPFGGGDE